MDEQKVRQGTALLLEGLGISQAGTVDTPQRVAAMYGEIFSGLQRNPEDELDAQFCEDYDELIVVKDIPFYSMCEHHLVPFFGKAHVAYIPQDGIVAGLGRLATVVDIYARRPQLQERLTCQIADLIVKKLNPAGVMVVIEAEHMCMTMRGANKPGTKAVTSAARGIFAAEGDRRAEVMGIIRNSY